DGIRDGHVTGVQTCALPILALEKGLAAVARNTIDIVGLRLSGMVFPQLDPGVFLVRKLGNLRERSSIRGYRQHRAGGEVDADARSEERRVGKECGVRGSWGQ